MLGDLDPPAAQLGHAPPARGARARPPPCGHEGVLQASPFKPQQVGVRAGQASEVRGRRSGRRGQCVKVREQRSGAQVSARSWGHAGQGAGVSAWRSACAGQGGRSGRGRSECSGVLEQRTSPRALRSGRRGQCPAVLVEACPHVPTLHSPPADEALGSGPRCPGRDPHWLPAVPSLGAAALPSPQSTSLSRSPWRAGPCLGSTLDPRGHGRRWRLVQSGHPSPTILNGRLPPR